MVNKTVILFPRLPASCGWVLQISFVQPESKLNILWKYIFPMKLCKASSKKTSSSQRDRREEESWRSLLLSAGLVLLFSRLKKTYTYTGLWFQTGCAFWPCLIMCILIPSGLFVSKTNQQQQQQKPHFMSGIIWIHCSLANNLSCFQ